MAEEVIVRTGRKLAVGDKWLDIRDNGEVAKFVDLILEARHGSGIICLSFGSGIIDGSENEGVVDVASRLRMHLGTAQFLHKLLGDMITDALKPVDKSQAN